MHTKARKLQWSDLTDLRPLLNSASFHSECEDTAKRLCFGVCVTSYTVNPFNKTSHLFNILVEACEFRRMQ